MHEKWRMVRLCLTVSRHYEVNHAEVFRNRRVVYTHFANWSEGKKWPILCSYLQVSRSEQVFFTN